MKTVKETVDDLNASFNEFKSAQEGVEKKSADTRSLEHKLEGLETKFDQAHARLNQMEITQSRPVVGDDLVGPQTQEHKSAFAKYVSKGDESYLQNMESKSLSVSSDPDGGYLVPDTLRVDIERNLKQTSVMRRLCGVMQISTDALELLVDHGQADAGWVAETDERGETGTPKLSKIRIPVHELYAKPRATQKLLDDSQVNVESWLGRKISARMSQLENHSFINGDGQNKPKGFLQYEKSFGKFEAGKIQAFKTGKKDNFADKNPADVLIDMINSVQPEHLEGAVWLMSRSAHGAIRKLQDAQGNYLWTPGLTEGARPKLLGYDVELCDDMPGMDSKDGAFAVAFGNFKHAYQIVDRANIRVLRDPFSVKPYVEFYTTSRVGGDVVNFDAIKVLSFSA